MGSEMCIRDSPKEIQEEYIRSIKGFENAKITQFGYAVEYDYIDPRNLDKTLRVKKLKNLFLAGQINGTTGYERQQDREWSQA